LAETCTDVVSGGPSYVLSKSDVDGDDNADNENYTDFEPEIARKIKKTVCHCIAIQKVEVPRNKTAMIEVRFMHCGGGGEAGIWQG
jgi:hypothetical protein